MASATIDARRMTHPDEQLTDAAHGNVALSAVGLLS
jgi:hypothetical protein